MALLPKSSNSAATVALLHESREDLATFAGREFVSHSCQWESPESSWPPLFIGLFASFTIFSSTALSSFKRNCHLFEWQSIQSKKLWMSGSLGTWQKKTSYIPKSPNPRAQTTKNQTLSTFHWDPCNFTYTFTININYINVSKLHLYHTFILWDWWFRHLLLSTWWFWCVVVRKSWFEFPQKSRGNKVKTAPLKLSITMVSPLSRVVPFPNGLKGLSMGVTNHLLTGMILQIGGGFKFKKKNMIVQYFPNIWNENNSTFELLVSCGQRVVVDCSWWSTYDQLRNCL